MIRFILVVLIIVAVLLIVKSRSVKIKNSIDKKNKFKLIIVVIIVAGILFLIATSGRYIFPQLIQILKVGLPFLTKFIGI